MATRIGDDEAVSGASGPRNVEQITKAAQQYEYNAQVSLRYWLRSANALLREADIYMQEGDQETTYLLLFRHAHLILAHLTTHSDARNVQYSQELNKAKKEVNRNLQALDALKPRINERHERFIQLKKDRAARQAGVTRVVEDNHTHLDTRILGSEAQQIEQLQGHEHKDLAVQLAKREFNRRAETRGRAGPEDDGEDLSRRLQAIRDYVDRSEQSDRAYEDSRRSHDGTGYRYPEVHRHATQSPSRTQYGALSPQHQQRPSTLPSQPPSLPPKENLDGTEHGPPLPKKTDVTTDMSKPGNAYSFTPTAHLENGAPLRTLFLPPTLRTTFLRLAHRNTRANLETCAFLAGTLISNALFVSKLIVPAQTATSDTCEMTNESQLFDYVDEADLMILGWIHTHPTQTCFMSSRDLHTHAGYQMMLAESIAIVCAPSKGDTTHGGDWGVYRLTDPPGKMAILNCTKPGLFHPHDVDHVYTDALRPGHVVEATGLDFEVVDLRDGPGV